MRSPVRVVLVDDHEIVRAGVRTLLAREPDIEVVASAPNGEEALQLIDRLAPDIAVVDYGLPKMSGVEVCEHIVKHYPKVSVIMLTGFLNDEIVKKSLEAGARAYVYKDVEAKELKRAIRAVADGFSIMDPKVAGRVMRWALREFHVTKTIKNPPLSAREVEVLRLIARGQSNKEIASTMGVSANTVKTYLLRATHKLDCHSRSEAVSTATRWGLL